MLPINSYMHYYRYIYHALMKLNGRGQDEDRSDNPSIEAWCGIETMRAIDAFNALWGRRHRKRRLVRELGGSRQGNRHPWWFSPDDRDWLCSPDRSRRCVSLHMLVTAAEFLLGPTTWTQLSLPNDRADEFFVCRLQAEWAPLWETSGYHLSGCGRLFDHSRDQASSPAGLATTS